MKQNKAYRAVEPEDVAILFLSVGEIGAMKFRAMPCRVPGTAIARRR